MLSRCSEVLQTAADVLAPPASRVVDFQYHWKLIQNFYTSENVQTKVHVDNTKIPYHLYQMLQFLVDEEADASVESPGPCVDQLSSTSACIAHNLTNLAEGDRPAGMRAAVLGWYTALLRRVKGAPIHAPSLYRPIQKLLITCSHNHASPTEKEEVELLLTLCGLVRKEPSLANLFLSQNYEQMCPSGSKAIPTKKPKKNKLFDYDQLPLDVRHISIVTQPQENHQELGNDCEDSARKISTDLESVSSMNDDEPSSDYKNYAICSEGPNRFLLMDLLLAYLYSVDNHIVLRACEGIMIMASLPDERIASLISNTSLAGDYLVDILIEKSQAIPLNTDPTDIDHVNVTWGFSSGEQPRCVGLRCAASFLSWLDYLDTLSKEAHPLLGGRAALALHQHFLQGQLQPSLANTHSALLATCLLAKCLKQVDSQDILNEMTRWLVGECADVTSRPPSAPLQILIHNCCQGNNELCLETLRLFETMLEKASEHILHCLVLGFLENRAYHRPPRLSCQPEEEERDRLNAQTLQQERDSNRKTMKRVCEGPLTQWAECSAAAQLSPSKNIHKVINSFLLLLPRNLLSDSGGLGYEQYMQDANRHYLAWVEATSSFNWPLEAVWHDPASSSTHSCDSRPEADLHMNSPCTLTQNRFRHHPPETRSVGVSAILIDSKGCHTEDDVFNNDSNRKENHLESNEVAKKESNKELIEETEVLQNGLPKTENGDEGNVMCERMSSTFHQQLVLSPKDRCSLSEMAEDDDMTFEEGPFFKLLFKLLLNMHNQPYQINLQLTAIFSKLAMMPHPYLHEYLLDPTLVTGRNVQTLFKTLQKLVKTFMQLIPKVPEFNSAIEATRKRLLGDLTTDECIESEPLFESLIVVEEFCKELAAISFVKYHHASLNFPP